MSRHPYWALIFSVGIVWLSSLLVLRGDPVANIEIKSVKIVDTRLLDVEIELANLSHDSIKYDPHIFFRGAFLNGIFVSDSQSWLGISPGVFMPQITFYADTKVTPPLTWKTLWRTPSEIPTWVFAYNDVQAGNGQPPPPLILKSGEKVTFSGSIPMETALQGRDLITALSSEVRIRVFLDQVITHNSPMREVAKGTLYKLQYPSEGSRTIRLVSPIWHINQYFNATEIILGMTLGLLFCQSAGIRLPPPLLFIAGAQVFSRFAFAHLFEFFLLTLAITAAIDLVVVVFSIKTLWKPFVIVLTFCAGIGLMAMALSQQIPLIRWPAAVVFGGGAATASYLALAKIRTKIKQSASKTPRGCDLWWALAELTVSATLMGIYMIAPLWVGAVISLTLLILTVLVVIPKNRQIPAEKK